VAELRRAPDAPEVPRVPADRPEVSRAAAPADRPEVGRPDPEPRTRAQYAADLRQRDASGWDSRPFPLDSGTPLARPADLESVRRFDPTRAGLPTVSARDAAAHLATRHADRPWLAAARACAPEVQRVIAALDQGTGHAHIRHEGWVTEDANRRRVAYLEDPAQLDPAKRPAGLDGFGPGDWRHRCGDRVSRIADPSAFAVAFARGIEDPRVRAALATPAGDVRPNAVQVPIAELLGADGHRYCTGWQLQPRGNSMDAAREDRRRWRDAAGQETSGAIEPVAAPIRTFEGGTLVFAFGSRTAGGRYEVVSMFPEPPRPQPQEAQ
jgi:hypothetical protein